MKHLKLCQYVDEVDDLSLYVAGGDYSFSLEPALHYAVIHPKCSNWAFDHFHNDFENLSDDQLQRVSSESKKVHSAGLHRRQRVFNDEGTADAMSLVTFMRPDLTPKEIIEERAKLKKEVRWTSASHITLPPPPTGEFPRNHTGGENYSENLIHAYSEKVKLSCERVHLLETMKVFDDMVEAGHFKSWLQYGR